jgi:hypothetical protein
MLKETVMPNLGYNSCTDWGQLWRIPVSGPRFYSGTSRTQTTQSRRSVHLYTVYVCLFVYLSLSPALFSFCVSWCCFKINVCLVSRWRIIRLRVYNESHRNTVKSKLTQAVMLPSLIKDVTGSKFSRAIEYSDDIFRGSFQSLPTKCRHGAPVRPRPLPYFQIQYYVEGVGQKSGPCTATFNDLLCLKIQY